ncbi:MAG: MFS transporter, partial [Eubacteriales bacterium]|nr:MFS transporter [Eubacteriales bacterium]
LGQRLVLAALLILFLPLPAFVSGICLFLIGLGNGPVFPNMLHLTPRYFSAAISQSVMGVQMACSYVGIMLAPALFGLIAQYLSPAVFAPYLLVLYAAMKVGTILLCRRKE